MTANNTTLQIKRGAAANLPILADGEPAFTTDTHLLYVGYGSTNYLINYIPEDDPMLYTDTNMLINGGFDICQRSLTPATLFAVADNKYSADRWRVNFATAGMQYQRLPAISYSFNSMYHGRFTKITAAGKIAVYQPIESYASVAMRNHTVQFQISFRVSSIATIKIGIIAMSSAATADAIPATFITAYNADNSDPTFAANCSLIASLSNASVPANTWVTYYVTATIPTNTVNVIPIIWTDAAAPINFTLDLAEASLFQPETMPYSTTPWKPAPAALEMYKCLRYFEAQYNNPTDYYRPFASGFCFSGTTLQGVIRYFPKRKIPAVSRSADSTLGWWKSNGVMMAISAATSMAIIYVSESCCVEKDVFAAGNFTAGDGTILTAYSTNAAYYLFDAEL